MSRQTYYLKLSDRKIQNRGNRKSSPMNKKKSSQNLSIMFDDKMVRSKSSSPLLRPSLKEEEKLALEPNSRNFYQVDIYLD